MYYEHPMPLVHGNRETWLHAASDMLDDQIREAVMSVTGDHVEPVHHRIACAFPPGTRPKSDGTGGNRVIGLCMYGQCSRDGATELLISPVIDSPRRALDILAHEKIHKYLPGHGHDKVFAAVATLIGLAGKPTATVAGEAFTQWADEMLAELGHYPHGRVTLTGRKKQTTRLVKVLCPDLCTDMPLRITRKWLDAGMAPLCPCCEQPFAEAGD